MAECSCRLSSLDVPTQCLVVVLFEHWWNCAMNRLPYPVCLSFTIHYSPPSCFLKYYFLLIFLETSSEENPLAIAITRLLALEQAIERRYLKHPLRNE